MLLLPWLPVTAHMVSWFLGIVGRLVGQRLKAREMRASIVNNMVCGNVVKGKAQDQTLMNLVAGWVHNQNNATMQCYLSNIAAAGSLGCQVGYLVMHNECDVLCMPGVLHVLQAFVLEELCLRRLSRFLYVPVTRGFH